MLHSFRCDNAFALAEIFAERLVAAARARRDPLDPLTVVAPTARLLARLRLLAAENLGAAANIQFLVHRSLAARILQFSGRSVKALSPVANSELAARAAAQGDGSLAQFIRRFPGARAAVASSFRDLRDAGVHHDPNLQLPGQAAELWRAYGRFERALAAANAADGAELYQIAAREAPAAAARFGNIIHAGVVDLTGVVSELLISLAAATDVTVLALGTGDGRAFEFGRARAERFVGAASPVRSSGRGFLHSATSLLFEPGSARRSAEEPRGFERIEWFDCPSASQELEAAARRILRWHAEGTPLEQIAVVARSLEEFAPLVEPVMRAHGIVVTSSARLPAHRFPSARAAIDLLECIVSDFPRQAWIRYLRSPALARAGFSNAARAVAGDAADALSREYQIINSKGWLAELPAQLAADARGSVDDDAAWARTARAQKLQFAEAAAAAVRDIQSASRPLLGARNYTDAARAFAELRGRFLNLQEGDAAAESLFSALSGVADLDAAGIPYAGPEDFYHHASSAVASATVPVARADAGGVRVLDLQQLRGLAFSKAIWIGFHEGSTPRGAREDPLLPDAAREAIVQFTKKPVPLKRDAKIEERWLFALALGSAGDGFVISYSRRDASQRPRNISPFARELGGPPPDRILTIPSHPARRFAAIARHDGMLHPRTAVAAAALCDRAPVAGLVAAADALKRYFTKDEAAVLESGAAWLAAVDAFAADDAESLRFDGVGAGVELLKSGVSAIERLGQCPLRYFFHDILRIRALDDPESDDPVDRAEIGAFVHAVLADAITKKLVDAARDRPAEWIHLAGAAIDAALDAHFEPIKNGRLRRAPGLAAAVRDLWRRALVEFTISEVARLAAEGVDEIERESEFTKDIAFDGESVTLSGRFDRVARAGGQKITIADYKTRRGKLDLFTKIRNFERADSLQLALYALVAGGIHAGGGAGVGVEAVSVRPDYDGAGFGAVESLKMDEFMEHRENMKKTIGSLLRSARAGAFPITLQKDHCKYCDFKDACRNNHAPTRARVASAGIFREYLEVTDCIGGGDDDDES